MTPLQQQEYLRAIDSAMRAGDVRRATELSAEAAKNGVEHPMVLMFAAYHFLERNEADKALLCANRARDISPRNPDILNALGVTLTKLNRIDEAVSCFDASLRYAPGLFITHFHKAVALEEGSQLRRAREHFERALGLNPQHADSMTHLAHMASQRGDMTEAREYGARALRLDPRQVYALFALAAADIHDKHFDIALAALSPVSRDANATPQTRSVAFSMMGDALDGLGRFDEAFRAYTQAGDIFHAMHAPAFKDRNAADFTRRLTSYFRQTPPEPWRNTAKGAFESPVKSHVFLVSFPRSGTTLLGQVLAAHPDVETMEEKGCLIDAYPSLADNDALDRLGAMSGEELDSLRQAYWQRVGELWSAPTRPVFVDKLPLNTAMLGVVAKLFPDAKILFAVRDPRDVVLSAFRRRFGMTQQMFELLTLQSTAAYYDAVMQIADVYREKLGLQRYDARYETLVEDFAGETKRICDFLGLAYTPEMEQFAPKAKARHIDTPSAAQVAQGLFAHGIGQWRPYRDQLAPVMPILSRWVARFGYPAE